MSIPWRFLDFFLGLEHLIMEEATQCLMPHHLDDIGEHEIRYIARLYNIVPQIDEFTQTIDELVVEYEPIYESYVYPILRDDGKVAFDDRIGYALHYFGNESTDANPDDEIGIHEDRRSKINDYFYSTWGADPWEFDFIDGTTPIVTDYSEDIHIDMG